MRVWDLVGSWFHGGAKLHLRLDAERTPAGGLLGGAVNVEAGRRGIEVDGLRVCLLRTAVRSRNGSPAGDIIQRTVVDAVVGSGLRLDAKHGEDVTFAIRVPADAPASDDETSYRVRVELQAPDGKRTHVQVPVRIVDASAVRPALETIVDRWPALRGGGSGQALADALRELRARHDTADPSRDLLAIEPRLSAIVTDREAEPVVREAALDAWVEILSGRGNRSHQEHLRRVAEEDGAAPAFVARIVEAAGRVAGAASVPLLRELSTQGDGVVRRAVALALARLPPSTASKRAALDEMARDRDADVRAAVFRAYAAWDDDADTIAAVAAHTTLEPSDAVLEACVGTLRGGFAHGYGAVARPVLERLSTHPSTRVRAAVARAMISAEVDLASQSMVDGLLSDPAIEVRTGAIGVLEQLFARLGDHAHGFLGRLENLAAHDPAPEVRAAALAALPALVGPEELCEYYRTILDAEPPPTVVRGILQGIRQHRTPHYDALLDELVDHPDRGLAADARDLLDAAS